MNIWGRLGISVAFVAMFTIVMTEILQERAFYQVYRWAICAGLLAMGTFLLVLGGFVNRKIREGLRDDPEGPKGPFLLVNLQYWGLMLTVFGVIVIFIVPFSKAEAQETRPAPKKEKEVRKVIALAPTNEMPPPPAPVIARSVVFPEVRVQGIVYRGERSSALLNGRTYFVGDQVEDIKVIAIGETNVVLERAGQQKVLQLTP